MDWLTFCLEVLISSFKIHFQTFFEVFFHLKNDSIPEFAHCYFSKEENAYLKLMFK
jgi:hypothetical protein